ncbi:MAG: heme-binding domain-containing protein [Planctomycetales bacterium 71-10]|nr:MAG: heme-binding domain-containing protein [Planctomycetales bacterium 71-10]
MPNPPARPKHWLAWATFVGIVALLTTDLICAQVRRDDAPKSEKVDAGLFARDNLTAWCIVPFDSKNRDPEARAAMLEKLGFKHFAYDWRAEHVPTFDAEVDALKRHGVELTAFWGPAELNDDSKRILDLLKRHHIKAQLWVLTDFGPDKAEGAEQERRVSEGAARVASLARAAAEIGCTVGLYNHGGWFGEPENQIAIIERLKKDGIDNVGLVYNLHHGHDHLDRLPALLKTMMPHLMALNINGMDVGGDRVGRKILPLGQGEEDLKLLRIIRESGYKGRIGILGHTQDDAEERLRDNLDGLDWLVPQLDGAAPGPKPTPRTPVPPRPAGSAGLSPAQAQEVAAVLDAARKDGDPARGAAVFTDVRFTCYSCHKVGEQGGEIGPELTTITKSATPEEIAASVLWPRLKVKPEYEAFGYALDDGRIVQGYKVGETAEAVQVRDVAFGEVVTLPKDAIDEAKPLGTLMPEGLASTMSPRERADLFAFLLTLGAEGATTPTLTPPVHAHAPAEFEYDGKPLRPEFYASADDHVNRHRTFDFYAKEADFFRRQPSPPPLLPMYPGLDGGKQGHWGNQNESTWADGRWNESDLGSVLAGVFRAGGETIPKAVCLRLGDKGELSACFDPQTLTYPALWTGGFVKFSSVRHGFMEGLILNGQLRPKPEGAAPTKPFTYHGFHRHGKRVIFSYAIDGEEWLDAPWVDEAGTFVREAGPAATHRLRDLVRGGPSQWPQTLVTHGKRSETRPFAIDVIEPPTDNPWKSLMFFGGLDFLADGTAIVATMEGDVWRVSGLDDSLANVSWRRFASGLHQPQGVVVADGAIYVLGRDQITELKDLDGDGEADFYRCVNNAYTTSPAGHDFICGLQRDAAGNFYTASGAQGIIRVPPDGGPPTVLATGFRNPDGVGLTRSGILSAPQSEGEWVPTSQVCDVTPGGHYGYTGPKGDKLPDLPLVYLPRGIDNSSSEQVEVTSDRWGPFQGNRIHLSFGAAGAFLLLRDVVDGQAQGAVWPIPGDYLSGIHRGRFNPVDGQLYVVGQSGWGTYSTLDGCFQRLRYTGDPIQAPRSIRVVENGVVLGFNLPIDPSAAAKTGACFAQAWNYRYSGGYGSLEYSTKHPGTVGHDVLPIRGVHVVGDGRTLFLEIPDVQPVDTLHLRLDLGDGWPQELFATVHKLAPAFADFPGYRPTAKVVAAHPRLADMAALKFKKAPNPWAKKLPNARKVEIAAGKNLTYATPAFKVKAGETIALTFVNPDVVPHNWVLLRPGSLATVGDLVNKIIAEPDAAARNYIPKSDDVLNYVDVVDPRAEATIHFKAPAAPGRYPFLCSFPGHWMVMNGVMTVE